MTESSILPIILTTYKTNDRVCKLIKQCTDIGLQSPKIWFGLPAKNETTLVQTICKTHYDITQWFSIHSNPHDHLLILEDDCMFLPQNSPTNLNKYIHTLNKSFPQWRVLTLGQVNLFFILPTFVSTNIWACSLPFMAHSYILNGNWVRNHFPQWKDENWIRPYAVEGWINFPLYTKFSIVPGLTTQTSMPREMTQLLPPHIHKRLTLYKSTNAIDIFWILCLFLFVLGLCNHLFF